MLGEPFYLDEQRLAKLTSLELWEEYIKPAKERGEALKKELDRAKRDDVFCPETPEQIEQANAMMRALFGAPKQ